MKHLFRILAGCFFLAFTSLAHSLSPIIQSHDIVAGTGEPGFADGPFYESQFSGPLGLSLDPAATTMYVADRDNNRIRSIAFEDKNRVSTVAGTGAPGNQNGPVTTATFNLPSGVVFIPENQIAVNDLGNGLIRLIDLKTNMVSTLVGGGPKAGAKDGQAIQLSSVWNMVYFSQDNSLYFSQPQQGLLQRINLKDHLVETILQGDPKVPHPAALCVVDDKLYVADSTLTQIYEVKIQNNKKAGDEKAVSKLPEVQLQSVGEAHDVIALTGYKKTLYAYQADKKAPIFRVLPNPGAVIFTSVWGQRLTYPDPGSILLSLRNITSSDRVGFVADPRWIGRFYISTPKNHFISTFCDLHFTDNDIEHGEDTFNSAWIHDLEYPYTKPPHTFRILLIGRSYLFWQADDRQFEAKNFEGENQNLLTTLAKKMELSLNTKAALEDEPIHYEVLNGGMHHGNNELNVWPYYVVPDLVKKYDVDLVMIMKDPSLDISSFRMSPTNDEGVPADMPDLEFRLKPDSEKFKKGALHDFFELLRTKKLLKVQGQQWGFDNNAVLADPEAKAGLIHVMGKPLKLLEQKVTSMKTSDGKSCQLGLCYFPIFFLAVKSERAFWKDLCHDSGIPYLDLSDDFMALGLTYWPYFGPSIGHFTKDGMSLFSDITIHELISNKLIPVNSKADPAE